LVDPPPQAKSDSTDGSFLIPLPATAARRCVLRAYQGTKKSDPVNVSFNANASGFLLVLK
jgi:hypothetical protein